VVRSASSRADEGSQPRRPRLLGAVLATHDAPRLFRLGLIFDVAATPPPAPDHQQCRQTADQHQRRDGAAGAHHHRAASCTVITITIPLLLVSSFCFFPLFSFWFRVVD